jgi:hypothetical protein
VSEIIGRRAIRAFNSFLCPVKNRIAEIMNNLLTKPQPDVFPQDKEMFSALIAYEDTMTRDRALRICDRLVAKFWKDVEFDYSWWRFDFLRDREILDAAAHSAARADLILVSAHSSRELPSSVQGWIETWLPLRKSGGGVLGAMIGTREDQLRGLTPIHVYLREAAQRANMDFLSQMIDAPLGRLDGSFETITNRAEKVTSLLDNILHRPSNPRHWGINE